MRRDMLAHYQVFLRRQVEKEETARKEPHFISGIFNVITTGLQVIMYGAEELQFFL